MKMLLVPIDFSKNAKHAAKYAALVAKQLDASITFLYVQNPPLVPEYNLPPGIEQYLAQNQQEAINNMETFVADFIEDSKLAPHKVLHKITTGFIAEKIVAIAQEIKANMIIMGTKGVSDAFDRWIGTAAQKVMNMAECPVWIIPQNANIHFPKKFIYASDFENDETTTKHKINNIIQLFDATCELVHITENPNTFAKSKMEAIVEQLAENNKFSIRTLNGNNVAEALNSYIKIYSPDVLVLAHYTKTFLEKIFEPSITKYFVQEAKLPLLVVNKND